MQYEGHNYDGDLGNETARREGLFEVDLFQTHSRRAPGTYHSDAEWGSSLTHQSLRLHYIFCIPDWHDSKFLLWGQYRDKSDSCSHAGWANKRREKDIYKKEFQESGHNKLLPPQRKNVAFVEQMVCTFTSSRDVLGDWSCGPLQMVKHACGVLNIVTSKDDKDQKCIADALYPLAWKTAMNICTELLIENFKKEFAGRQSSSRS